MIVPAAPDAAENEGWLMSYVHDGATDTSSLQILDATDVTAPPDELDAPEPQAEIDPEDDPDTIRQKVIDDLRAQGVEGDIQVEVIPTEDGHFKVEVHVEQQEEQ